MASIKKFDVTFTVSVLAIFFLPSFIFVTFTQTSLAPGLMLTSILIIAINCKQIIDLRMSSFGLIIFLAIFFYFMISSSYYYIVYELEKPIISLAGMSLFFFSAYVFSVKLEKIHFQSLEYSILLIILCLLCLGWIAIFSPIAWRGYGALRKSVLPFSEPSHYALSVGLLSVGYAVTGRRSIVVFIVINMVLISLALPSLTLLVSVTLTMFAGLLRLRPKNFKRILLVSPFVILVFLAILSRSQDYFANRLSFEESTNLTTLVFLQGWYLAFVNTINTNGLGLGFQMLGMPGTYLTPYSEVIYNITGAEYNLSDGGLLAAKIIAEFGVIGLILCVLYFICIINCLLTANNILGAFGIMSSDKSELNKKPLLLIGLLFGFYTELIFRGYGYFSPGLYLVIAILISNKKNLFNPLRPLTSKRKFDAG